MWGPREGGRAGAGAAGSARTRLALKPWRPDSGQGGGVRPQAERKPPGPSGRDVGRVPACWGPVGRGWGGPSGRGGLSGGRGRPEAGPRLVLVPAPPEPPRLWREAFGTPSRVSPAPLLSVQGSGLFFLVLAPPSVHTPGAIAVLGGAASSAALQSCPVS